jgi:hypothetical protein
MQVSRSLRALPGAGVAWFVMRPRRRPRLDRVPRTAAFRTHHSAAAAWVDRQFRLIESAAPWLERAGMAVEDGCRLSRDSHGWVVSHGDRWHISCTRAVTAAYGASGDAARQVRELACAVGTAGWACYGDRIPDPVARLADLVLDPFQQHGSGHATAGWRPAGNAEPPPGWRPPVPPLAAKPPLSLIIHAEPTSPASPGLTPSLPPPLRGRQRLGPPAATPFYQPVELSEEDTATLVKRASATARHVFVVSIRITYLERSR